MLENYSTKTDILCRFKDQYLGVGASDSVKPRLKFYSKVNLNVKGKNKDVSILIN